MSDKDVPGSSPCFAHTLEHSADGSLHTVDPQQHSDVMRWRKGERKRLIDARLAIPASERAGMAAVIAGNLKPHFGDVSGKTISFYWPLRGEPDMREVMADVAASGAQCALPVVVERNAPLEFHAWTPGEPLERGFWNIFVPKQAKPVQPDIVLSPVVGFDQNCYRLGYGGGYFDRTLAVMEHAPMVLGVGYSSAAIATIFPQPHDIPLHKIVTDTGTCECAGS